MPSETRRKEQNGLSPRFLLAKQADFGSQVTNARQNGGLKQERKRPSGTGSALPKSEQRIKKKDKYYQFNEYGLEAVDYKEKDQSLIIVRRNSLEKLRTEMVLLKRVLYSQRKQFEVAMRTIKKDIVVLRKERKLIERQTAYLNDIQRNHLQKAFSLQQNVLQENFQAGEHLRLRKKDQQQIQERKDTVQSQYTSERPTRKYPRIRKDYMAVLQEEQQIKPFPRIKQMTGNFNGYVVS